MIADYTYSVKNLTVTPVKGWLDVTDEIEVDDPPFTLAKNDGFGVLQFTVATYIGGESPRVDAEKLRKLLADFSESRELGKGFGESQCTSPVMSVGNSFTYGTNFLRAWYCSDGNSLVLVTYLCERGFEESELQDVEEMVALLRFKMIQP